MITSSQNEKARYLRALQDRRRFRQQEQRLVFEGVRLVEEAVLVGFAPVFAFYTEPLAADERGRSLLAALGALGVPSYAVSEAVLAACSDTETPQGVLAVLPIPTPASPPRPTLTLVVDGVRDPGNLGTMLRTALAAGVEQVVLAPGTVDVTSPKVVRAAMGAHLRLPTATLGWEAIAAAVRDCDVWLAAASGAQFYTAVDWTRPAALVVGSEAEGASAQGHCIANGLVSIPMAAGVESLNAAVAAAVIIFEAARQRRAVRVA